MGSTNGVWGTTNGARSTGRARILAREEGAGLDVVLGVVLGMVLAASLAAGWRFVSAPRRVLEPGSAAMQGAVHAATAILPHLRRGLTSESAESAAPALLVITGADAVALAGPGELLAYAGAGAEHHRGGDPLESLVPARREDRVHVEPRIACTVPGCPLRSAIVAPLAVRDRRVGVLVALYERSGRVRLEESRVVAEAAALVSAMVELSELEAQGERLARAELRAAFIHSRPEEARELLIEFSEFIRYAFARQRPYVTLADELQYVEKYLRLEQARFGERLRVRVQVDPEVLQAVVPVLSLQPLVENAVRHGVESRPEGGLVSIEGIDLGTDVELRVSDDGAGIDPERAKAALSGGGPGIGLGNVHGRLQSTFGEGYGLMVENGDGTTVVMTLPKFRPGVRAG
jgi:two-component system LytT family sensor kinase